MPFKRGDTVCLTNDIGLSADKGALAIVTRERYYSRICGAYNIEIEWIRKDLASNGPNPHDQDNGGYAETKFSLICKDALSNEPVARKRKNRFSKLELP